MSSPPNEAADFDAYQVGFRSFELLWQVQHCWYCSADAEFPVHLAMHRERVDRAVVALASKLEPNVAALAGRMRDQLQLAWIRFERAWAGRHRQSLARWLEDAEPEQISEDIYTEWSPLRARRCRDFRTALNVFVEAMPDGLRTCLRVGALVAQVLYLYDEPQSPVLGERFPIVALEGLLLDLTVFVPSLRDLDVRLPEHHRIPATAAYVQSVQTKVESLHGQICERLLGRETQADSKADKRVKKSAAAVPRNLQVCKLAQAIRRRLPKGDTRKAVALEFTDGNETRAASLLRQLRRHPHLLR